MSAEQNIEATKKAYAAFAVGDAAKSYTSVPEHFLGDDQRVVVLTKATVDGESSDQADVLTFRDGNVVKFQGAGDTALAERVWGSK